MDLFLIVVSFVVGAGVMFVAWYIYYDVQKEKLQCFMKPALNEQYAMQLRLRDAENAMTRPAGGDVHRFVMEAIQSHMRIENMQKGLHDPLFFTEADADVAYSVFKSYFDAWKLEDVGIWLELRAMLPYLRKDGTWHYHTPPHLLEKMEREERDHGAEVIKLAARNL